MPFVYFTVIPIPALSCFYSAVTSVVVPDVVSVYVAPLSTYDCVIISTAEVESGAQILGSVYIE